MKKIVKFILLKLKLLKYVINFRDKINNILLKKKIYKIKKSNFFYFYSADFDAEKNIIEFKSSKLKPEKGYITNYMGAKFPIKIYPHILNEKSNSIDNIPIPSNWHTDIIEISSVLEVVKNSKDHFKMIEVGSGWGCWMVISGLAAKKLNKKVSLIGVEASNFYLKLSEEILNKNNFQEHEYKLFNNIIGNTVGWSIFPKFDQSENWGAEAIIYPTCHEVENAKKNPKLNLVKRILLNEIIFEKIDLMHIDIQGNEYDFISEQFQTIKKFIRNIVVGTHGRIIDGKIIDFLEKNNFRLRGERPTLSRFYNNQIIVETDGLQFWENLYLKNN